MSRQSSFLVRVCSLTLGLVACQPASTSGVPTPYYLYLTPTTRPISTSHAQGSLTPALTPAHTQPPIGTASPLPSAANVPNLAELQQYFLTLVNQARVTEGSNPVAWDDFAAQVGQHHAEAMAAAQYMSHWNELGYGPDIRYGLAGGPEWVQENVYAAWYRYNNGQPVPIADWRAEVEKAHEAWLNSPSHRANILAPEHTHLGIGIAYNPTTGDVRMAQEFINRYATLEAWPNMAVLGETVVVTGQLSPSITNLVGNLAYEPFPSALSIAQLNQTSAYGSSAQFIKVVPMQVTSQGYFTANLTLPPKAQPGFYHIWLWATIGTFEPQIADLLIQVGQSP